MVRTPRSVVDAISGTISREEARKTALETRAVNRGSFITTTIVLATLIAAGAFIISFSRGPAMPAANDVIVQSLSNFHALASGTLVPDLVSDEPQNIERFFLGKTEFPVTIPLVGQYRLVGASLNDYSGASLAHLMYKHDNELLYVYQTCWQTVVKGEKLNLSPQAKSALLRTGWFADSRPEGEAIVLWAKGNTLYAAVAHMTALDLRARIEPARDASPW